MKKAGFGHLKKVPRSREEAQKEILDAELDLITKQQVSLIFIVDFLYV